MNRVFKCDSCVFTDPVSSVTLRHERNCGHDPLKKSCNSCNSSVELGMCGDSIMGCNVQLISPLLTPDEQYKVAVEVWNKQEPIDNCIYWSPETN